MYIPPYQFIKGLVDEADQGDTTLYELIEMFKENGSDNSTTCKQIIGLKDYNIENITLRAVIDQYEQKQRLYLFIGFIVLALRVFVISFGVVGNILSLITWSRPQLKSASSIVFIVLAICDTMIMLCGLWIGIPGDFYYLEQYRGEKIDSPALSNFLYGYYTQWSYIVVRAMYHIGSFASMYLTLIITVQRYICICHPFWFEEWSSYSRTCKFVVITMIVSVIYHSSSLWEYRVVEFTTFEKGEKVTLYTIVRTELYNNYLFDAIKNTWVFILIDYVLPLTCIVTLNAISFIQFKILSRKRREITDSQKNEDKLTKMILYVVMEFLVFTSFTGFLSIIKLFSTDISYFMFTMPGPHYFTRQVQYFFDSLNSSVNIVTYYSSWPPFRKVFTEMFWRQKRHNQPPLPSPGYSTSKMRTTPV